MIDLIYIFIPLFLIAYGIYHLIRRGLQMKELATQGVLTQAQIIDRQEFTTAKGARRNDRYLRYQYVDAQGRHHTARSHVVSRDWLANQNGDSIDIVYLPHRPEVSALASDVENARKALK